MEAKLASHATEKAQQSLAAHVPASKGKRKRSAPTELVPSMTEKDAEDMIEGMPIDKSCNQVRTQIRNFIEAGGMKIGEFQKAIGVSSRSYSTFMSRNGPDGGSNTATYGEAWAFFKKRELMGIAMPKKAKKAPAAAPATTEAAASNSKSKATSPGALTASQLTHIHLDNESSDSVPIYDDCDDIRRKITPYLSQPGTTAAQLCRDMASMFTLEPGKKIQNKVLTDFRNKRGPLDGNTSSVFYGAYCYFEKVRVHEGKEKSVKRKRNEGEYGKDGVDTKKRESQWIWTGPGMW